MSLSVRLFLFEVMIWFAYTIAHVMLLFLTLFLTFYIVSCLFLWFAPSGFMAYLVVFLCGFGMIFPFTWASKHITNGIIAFINRR